MYGFLAIRSIRVDCWISKLFTRQTLELPTDRPTNRKSAKKKLSDFRKSLHVQSIVIFERHGLVFFVEQHDFDDPGIDDLINEEPSPISGTRRARHVGGRRRDTHTAKCEHTVKHYCFIDIDTFIYIYTGIPPIPWCPCVHRTISLK